MPYSYFEWLQGLFIVHSTTGSTVHSRPLNSLEHCICTTTTTNIPPDQDSNLVPPGYKPQSIRMSHQGRPLISKARRIKNGAIVFPGNEKSSLCLKYWRRYDNFCYDVMAAILFFYDTCSDVVRGITNKCIACFIACLDSENIWLGGIILSLSDLLTKIWSL